MSASRRDPIHASNALRRDVNALGAMLGETISELTGLDGFHRIESIRRLSRGRRLGDEAAEEKLREAVAALTLDQAEEVIRAFTLFFDFSNIAEDRQRIRVLREREQSAYPEPLAESIGAAIASLKRAGKSEAEVQTALHALSVQLVFTAHPSEAKRRTVRAKLRRMRHDLQEASRPGLSAAEREAVELDLRTEARVLWQTEGLRRERPKVLDELDRCLSLAPRLWEVLPAAYAALRDALARYYPGVAFEIPAFLRFGCWVGGDRDGHPDVTNPVTAEALQRLRATAIGLHLQQCSKLHALLSMAERLAPASKELHESLEAALLRWPEAQTEVSRVAVGETYRQFLAMMRWRLERSHTVDAEPRQGYRDGGELEQDAVVLRQSLGAFSGTEPLAREVQTWVDLIRGFGLHLASLDIRQDSALLGQVMSEMMAAAQLSDNFAALDDKQKCALLRRSMSWRGTLDRSKLSVAAVEILGLFELIETAVATMGPEAIGGFIISMTQAASDVLGVLWLWRQARQAKGKSAGDLRIMPLFERIGDLESAAATLDEILAQPDYRGTLVRSGFRQTIMLGYSDSTKDGGYLSACWGLWRAQTELHQTAARHGIAVTFFHGRGGSLGRGGGPAARGILSLPRRAFDGSLRLTEQGEVLVERYDDVQIAARHLDQVVWAAITAATEPTDEPPGEWLAAMDALAEASRVAYRDLVDSPGFLEFFALATPIDEIEDLPIGSRPARRRARASLSDLRAIPWVFSWTQNRCIIPAWYGLGAAIAPFAKTNLPLLKQMYQRWPFFQATIDNAELALAKMDLYIAGRYAELAGTDAAHEIWRKISGEYQNTRTMVLALTGHGQLLAQVPWFQASIEARNPYVDPLNLIQIELLRRKRGGQASPGKIEDDTEAARLKHLLRLSIQGIAAGLRTTG